jgi:hypothetical protein
MPGRAGSKLSVVTEHQALVDIELPDTGLKVLARNSPKQQKHSRFVEALQLMFQVNPSRSWEG